MSRLKMRSIGVDWKVKFDVQLLALVVKEAQAALGYIVRPPTVK